MADLKKAIKGMKCCRWGMCFGCPYNDGVHGNTGCKTKMLDDIIALLEALDVTPEELERLKKCRHECKIDCLLEHYDSIKAERDALLEAQDRQWTPITFRALTEEEKAEHPDWGFIIDSPTPDDGEEILVSDGRYVWADAWGNNGVECYLESDHELEGVAWMKMPTPWKREATPWRDA